MAGHCAQEPFIVSALVAAAMESMAADLLDATLASGPALPADAARWQDAPPASYRMVMQRALRSELAAGLEAYCQLAGATLDTKGFGGDAAVPDFVLPLWRVFLLEADLAYYRRALQEQVNRLSEPYANAVAGLAAAEFAQAGKAPASRGKDEKEKPYGLCTWLLPSLGRIGECAARADAQRRLGRIAVAVAAYRAAEGAYPARLEDLLPKYAERVPLDPFDDRPLRLAKRGNGVAVYSIGVDQKDDGGETKTQEGASLPADLVIRIGTGP
jgi:tetratricopeptide (TPR) repeat protein